MYKMNSRNRGITAANAIFCMSCFIFRTLIAIFVQYYGIFDENRKKTDFFILAISFNSYFWASLHGL